ncbi:hypothetical protein [Photobacterium sp. OFAV2-7]|uniref:hypothetical protein n=1 Tax=Photobacterium sp. OFAV2-7 TaxID=2917748 RepID=UPI001EF70D9D|nr:hypothetical protein [Photobacterium sp. OFAV2-7]MCG7586746.1 hypothetical protein [Photobacterium sp. OFAV2-7]
MRSVSVSDFIPSLRQLINVPLPGLMTDAIVKASQVFCRQSKVVTFHRSMEQVSAGQTVNVVVDSSENEATENSYKSSEVMSVTAEGDLLQLNVDYLVISRDEVRFLESHTNVIVVCALEPTQHATQLPVILLDDYLDGICAGAASLLYSQPDSDWFNAELSAFHDRKFVESYREAARFRLEASPDLSFRNPVRRREFF